MSDPVNPAHYSRLAPEPIDVIRAWKLSFCLGNVVKYIARHDARGGAEDLRKARRYLDFAIEEVDRSEHDDASARVIESARDKTPAEYLAEAEANLCEPSHLPPGARPLDVALREARAESSVLRDALGRVLRHYRELQTGSVSDDACRDCGAAETLLRSLEKR